MCLQLPMAWGLMSCVCSALANSVLSPRSCACMCISTYKWWFWKKFTALSFHTTYAKHFDFYFCYWRHPYNLVITYFFVFDHMCVCAIVDERRRVWCVSVWEENLLSWFCASVMSCSLQFTSRADGIANRCWLIQSLLVWYLISSIHM